MRLLMHSGRDAFGLGPSLARGLREADCQLNLATFDQPAATVGHRIARRFAPGMAFSEINSRLVKAADVVQPDVIWIFKGMEIYPRTLQLLRERGIFLVNYNADHPFEFSARGSGNMNVTLGNPLYHLHLTYSERIAREFDLRCPSVARAVIPFGHDVDDALYESMRPENEIGRVCFLGNPDASRAKKITQLVEAGIEVDVYGHRWDRFLIPSPLLRIYGQVNGNDMLRTLRRYRVQLNFFRPHNADSHNMRTFEVPACGGIMLAEDSIEHRAFFEHGREAFFFKSPLEMIDACRTLIALPQLEADAVRLAARQRCVRSGYSYRDRSHAALKVIVDIDAKRRLQRAPLVARAPRLDVERK